MQMQNSHFNNGICILEEKQPVKQDCAIAAQLEKNHPYNIMRLIIPHVHPPDLIQALLNLRPEAISLGVREKQYNNHLMKICA